MLLAIIIVLLVGSGLLALAETSLVRTSKVKAKSLADDGRRGARPLVRLVEHPEKFLNPVLLLVLICQLVSATLVGVLASQWLGAWGVLAATVFEVVVIFVFFEAVPKNWAVRNPERAALFSAPLVAAVVAFPPVKWISSVLIGLANLIIGGGRREQGGDATAVTESELLAMADVAHAEEVIETEEREFIHSIIEFGDTVVREVMVPRPDMVTLDADDTVTAGLAEALTAGFSRLPVSRANLDDIVGIAYIKDLMRIEREGRGSEPVGAHMRPAHFVPETKRLATLLPRDARAQGPPVDGGRRVRGHGRPGHPRGPASRSWSARSSTSSTSRSRRRSSAWPTAAWSWRAGCPSTRSTSCSAPSCPRGPGTPSAAWCSTWPAGSRPRGSRWRSTASRWWLERVQGRRIDRVRIERTGPASPAVPEDRGPGA